MSTNPPNELIPSVDPAWALPDRPDASGAMTGPTFARLIVAARAGGWPAVFRTWAEGVTTTETNSNGAPRQRPAKRRTLDKFLERRTDLARLLSEACEEKRNRLLNDLETEVEKIALGPGSVSRDFDKKTGAITREKFEVRVQKKKNIVGLHEAAAAKGFTPLLEVSTKSEEKLGQRLSAFSLKINSSRYGEISLESAYQGSKVFERGGPYTDLYSVDAREAKKDPRIRDSGRIIAFRFDGTDFPTEPKTAFYDWLYFRAIYPHREFLRCLDRYAGFTDIEFNPEKSLNCQARSCAIFTAMMKRGILDRAMESPQQFIAALRPDSSTEPAPGDSRGIERAGHGDLYRSDLPNRSEQPDMADGRLKAMVQHVADQTPQSIIIGVRLDGPVSDRDRVHYPLTAVAGASVEKPDHRAMVVGFAKLAETINDLIEQVAPKLGVTPAEMREDVQRQREP